MISETTKWWGHYNSAMIRYEFQCIRTNENGRFGIYATFEYEKIDTGSKSLVTSREPTLVLEPEDAQSLMNALWNAGLRPLDGQGGLAHTNAQAAHIADLRAIVMKKCGVSK